MRGDEDGLGARTRQSPRLGNSEIHRDVYFVEDRSNLSPRSMSSKVPLPPRSRQWRMDTTYRPVTHSAPRYVAYRTIRSHCPTHDARMIRSYCPANDARTIRSHCPAHDVRARPTVSYGSWVKAAWRLPSQYRLDEVIGSGSCGSVRAAYDSSLKRRVAVKRMGRVSHNLADCKRILREIAILSELRHSGIVHFHGIHVAPDPRTFDTVFVIMELCDSDLRRLCRSNVELGPAHVATLLYGLVTGLGYVHSAGICHRDLKPENCLVNEDCSVKICDFGQAQAASGEIPALCKESCNMAPRSMAACGLPGVLADVTPWYCAPEILLHQTSCTEAVDIWSLGCIFAELLGILESSKVEDRGPLFPGLLGFMPMHGPARNLGGCGQLEMIFDIIGTPLEADIAELDQPRAQDLVRSLEHRHGEGLQRKFPRSGSTAVGLLEKMLRFSPRNRIAASEALDHPMFAEVRDRSKEVMANKRIQLSLEKGDSMDEFTMRRLFLDQVVQQHQTSVHN